MGSFDFSDLGIIVTVQIVTFLALVVILRQIMFSASRKEIERLRELNAENQKKAEKLAKELDRAEREHQRKIEKAEEELKVLRASTREESERQKEQILKKAREDGDKIVNQALSVKERIRQELQGKLQEQSIQLGVRMIGKVLTEDRMKWFHDGLVNDVIAEMRQIDPATFAGIDTNKEGVVRTPYELSNELIQQIGDALTTAAGRNITVLQATDKDVIAGLVITIGSLMIDGSLAGKLRQAADETRNQ
jgi:F0F1-type ATP synthase membrane subunit b/b'